MTVSCCLFIIYLWVFQKSKTKKKQGKKKNATSIHLLNRQHARLTILIFCSAERAVEIISFSIKLYYSFIIMGIMHAPLLLFHVIIEMKKV